jgi:hypothetical protein
MAMLALMSAPSPVAAQTPAAPVEIKRPAYQVRRFDELAKAAIAIAVDRLLSQVEPGFPSSPLSTE